MTGCAAVLHSPGSCPGEAWEGPLRTLVLQVGHRVREGKGAALTPTGSSGRPRLGAGCVPVVRAAGPEPAAALPGSRAGAGRGLI